MFKFKKFSIDQENCAMKICTDACIFGSYIDVSESESILDIGTGTGLLSLMLAQRTEKDLNQNHSSKKPIITAVEIEEKAFLTAKNNFEESIYKDRLAIFHSSIQQFSSSCLSTFKHIISNPPFFLHQSKTENNSKNLALHSEALSFEELLNSINVLLSENGKCDILLPVYEMNVFIKKAKNYGLFPQKRLIIYTKKEQQAFREIIRFERKNIEKNEIIESNFVIYKSKGENNIDLNRGYTDEFVMLLRNFYIIF